MDEKLDCGCDMGIGGDDIDVDNDDRPCPPRDGRLWFEPNAVELKEDAGIGWAPSPRLFRDVMVGLEGAEEPSI